MHPKDNGKLTKGNQRKRWRFYTHQMAGMTGACSSEHLGFHVYLRYLFEKVE